MLEYAMESVIVANADWIVLTYLPALVLLIAVSGFFSASEAALFSLSWTQRKHLHPSRPADQRALDLLAEPEKLLSAILFWNLTVNMSFFAVSGATSARLLRLPNGEPWAAAFALGSMLAIIFLGELVPKSFGVLHPLRLTRAVSWPMQQLVRIVQPVTGFLRTMSELSRRVIWPGLDKENYLDIEDLEKAIELSTEDADLIEQEKCVLQNIIRLSDTRAEEWMQPRSQFPSFAWPLRLSDLRGELPPGGYLLIHDRDYQEIQYAIRLSDITARFANELDLLRKSVLVVPWCATLADVYQRMVRQSRPVAVVVNEYGETIGLLTFEDLMEAAFDVQNRLTTTELNRPSVVSVGEDQWEVTGTTSIRRLERAIGRRLPQGDFVTLAGVIHDQLRRLAVPGDRCPWGEFLLEVLESPRRGEMLVRMTKIPREGTEV